MRERIASLKPSDIILCAACLVAGLLIFQFSDVMANQFPAFDTLACGDTPSDSCITGAIFTVGIFYLIVWLFWLGLVYVAIPLSPLMLLITLRFRR